MLWNDKGRGGRAKNDKTMIRNSKKKRFFFVFVVGGSLLVVWLQ